MLKKIIKRIAFLIRESWGKSFGIIWYSIAPSSVSRKMKNNLFLVRILEKRGLLKHDKENKVCYFKNFSFSYHDSIPIGDIIGIHLTEDSFVRKNIVNNTQIGLEGPYEHAEVVLQEGDVVIDAGANIGIFSLLASQKVGSTGKVFAFEPIQETQRVLRKNIEQNKCSNTQVIPYALGGSDTEVEFFVDMNRLVKSSKFDVRIHQYTDIEKVKQIKLDSFVENEQLKKIDFIKADIEGAEREFLKGAEFTIKKYRPRLAICTYHLPDDPEVIENLITSFVPEYNIIHTETKIFAWID